MEINRITEIVIGAAIEIHRELGPGLLESAYQACMAYEPLKRGVAFQREKAASFVYKDVPIDCGYRIDLVVGERVVVELKSVERLDPIHQARMLTCLKLTGDRVGLLIIFNVPVLKAGIRRFVL